MIKEDQGSMDKKTFLQNEKGKELGRWEEFTLLLDNIEILVWYLKDEETYGSCNQAHADFLALEKRELEGKKLQEIYPQEEAHICIQGNRQVFQTKRQIRSQEWVMNEKGEKRLLSIIKTPKLNSYGEVEYVICSGQDITDSYLAKEKLRQNEKRLRAIIEDQTELICRFLPGGILTFVNEAYCTYFHKKKEDLLGKSFLPLIPNEDQGISERHVASLSLKNPVTHYEHRVILPGGDVRWQEWTDRAIFNEAGAIIEYQAVGRDITSQKEMEAALQNARDELESRIKERTLELEDVNQALWGEIIEHQKTERKLAKEKERLAVTLSSIGDGVISTDIKGRIEMINESAETITRWKKKEAIGRHIEEVISLLGSNGGTTSLLSNQEKDPLIGQDFLFNRRDGKKRFLFSRSAPIKNKEGSISGYVIVFSDITQKKRYEEQRSLSQKLESIGQLTAGVAHEINTPLNYFKENSTFLTDSFQRLEKHLKKYVSWIKDVKEQEHLLFLLEEIPQALVETNEGLHRMTEIVSSMMDFAHPGRGAMGLADLNKAIESTVTISRNRWKGKADVMLDLDKNLPPVLCIVNEINQVFLNLIINAIQAIEVVKKDEKGRIIIKTRVYKKQVEITIFDSGTGIPQENQHRIFDPFFTTKEIGEGTGQGLAIAYDIVVMKHKGEILVQSEIGKGTAMIIYLPLSRT